VPYVAGATDGRMALAKSKMTKMSKPAEILYRAI
jgi:hypothetical protein